MRIPFERPGIRTYRQRELAQRMAGHLECVTCHRREPCPSEYVQQYLDSGWPKCCGGETMRLVPTPPEAA